MFCDYFRHVKYVKYRNSLVSVKIVQLNTSGCHTSRCAAAGYCYRVTCNLSRDNLNTRARVHRWFLALTKIKADSGDKKGIDSRFAQKRHNMEQATIYLHLFTFTSCYMAQSGFCL